MRTITYLISILCDIQCFIKNQCEQEFFRAGEETGYLKETIDNQVEMVCCLWLYP